MKKFFQIVLFGLCTICLCGCTLPEIAKLNNSSVTETAKSGINKIVITKNDVSPEKIIVKKNTTVTFVNEDESTHIIASDPHPGHGELSDLYSPTLFKGKTFSYKFQKRGKFGFHLEDNPSISGQIVVE